jgi:hypothetical protein
MAGQGICMSGCAAMAGLTGVAEVGTVVAPVAGTGAAIGLLPAAAGIAVLSTGAYFAYQGFVG